MLGHTPRGRLLPHLLVLALLASTLTLRPSAPAAADHGPAIRVGDAHVGAAACPCPEGDVGSTSFQFDVVLDETLSARSTTITADWVTAAGSATAGEDYTAAEGTLSFPPGVSRRTIAIPVSGDTTPEPDESFDVVLTDVSPDAHVADETGLGVIADDDSVGDLPTFSIADTSAGEGDDTMTFGVTLDRPAGTEAGTYQVVAKTADRSATASALPPLFVDDYDAARTTLTFGPDETYKAFRVTVNQDTVWEGDETFTAALFDNSPDTSISNGLGTATIVEDEPASSIVIGDAVVDEDADDALTFPVAMHPKAAFEIRVDWATTDGTATLADDDYAADAGTLVFAPGETAKTVTVQQTADLNVEGDEVVDVVLSDMAPAGSIGDGTGSGTITNDDTGDRTLVIRDAAVAEGDAGTRPVVFTLELDGYSDQPVTVDFHTQSVSSASGASPSGAGQDYHPVDDRQIVIPAGTRIVTTSVDARGDVADEVDELFLGRIGVADGPAIVGDGTATATIEDDDPRITVDDAAAPEGDEGETALQFTIRTSAPPAEDLTVAYTTADGSATSGRDYTATAGTATIPAGATSATVDVALAGDRTPEGDETFTLRLSEPSDGELDDAVATGTILDDDEPPATVDAGPDRRVDTHEPVTFRATVTGDMTATPTWDLGDGSPTREGQSITHRFTRTGTYEVTVTVPGAGRDTAAITVVDTGSVVRRAGSDRVATSVAAARAHWTRASTVLLATSENFPDALAASALAGAEDAPLVLTPPDAVPDEVLDLLGDLRTDHVRILGGAVAVSDAAEAQLREAGLQVSRVEGVDRFATAAAVATRVGAPSGRAVIALGDHAVPSRAWPDALSAGSYAAGPLRMPVLLTRSDAVPQVTLDTLRRLGVGNVDLLGGPAAISSEVERQLEDAGVRVTRVAGDTRYGTSVAVAGRVIGTLPSGPLPVVFATGEAFPDGLAAGAVAARLGAPVVLVDPRTVPDEVAALLRDGAGRFDHADLMGGPRAVSDQVLTELARLMEG